MTRTKKKKKKTIDNTTYVSTKNFNCKKNKKIPKLPSQNGMASSNCLLILPQGSSNVTNGIDAGLNQSFYLITNPTSGTTINSQKINAGMFLIQGIIIYSFMVVITINNKFSKVLQIFVKVLIITVDSCLFYSL